MRLTSLPWEMLEASVRRGYVRIQEGGANNTTRRHRFLSGPYLLTIFASLEWGRRHGHPELTRPGCHGTVSGTEIDWPVKMP